VFLSCLYAYLKFRKLAYKFKILPSFKQTCDISTNLYKLAFYEADDKFKINSIHIKYSDGKMFVIFWTK
jgi:hypothetical protein